MSSVAQRVSLWTSTNIVRLQKHLEWVDNEHLISVRDAPSLSCLQQKVSHGCDHTTPSLWLIAATWPSRQANCTFNHVCECINHRRRAQHDTIVVASAVHAFCGPVEQGNISSTVSINILWALHFMCKASSNISK